MLRRGSRRSIRDRSGICLLIACFATIGCGDDGAEEAARDYLDAPASGEFARRCELSTALHRKNLARFNGALALMVGDESGLDARCEDDPLDGEPLPPDVQKSLDDDEIREVNVTGDAATAFVDAGRGEKDYELRLVRRNGTWLVDSSNVDPRAVLPEVPLDCLTSWASPNNSIPREVLAANPSVGRFGLLNQRTDGGCVLIVESETLVYAFETHDPLADTEWVDTRIPSAGEDRGGIYNVRVYEDGSIASLARVLEGAAPLHLDTSDEGSLPPETVEVPPEGVSVDCGQISLRTATVLLAVRAENLDCPTARRWAMAYGEDRVLPPGWDEVDHCSATRLSCSKDSQSFSADPVGEVP